MMTLQKILIVPALIAFCIANCAARRLAEPLVDRIDSHRIGVMTFNVENLFDTEHDPGKLDYASLPIAKKQAKPVQEYCAGLPKKSWKHECFRKDWSEEVLEAKLRELSRVIRQVNDGKGPDILILQEVENVAVLEQLRTKYLQTSMYGPAILIDGMDARGIDVAILSRLPMAAPAKLYPVPFENIKKSVRKDTREILAASFYLPDLSTLTVFAVHFPAPFYDRKYRIQSMAYLNKLKKEFPADHLFLAAGDFNISAEENRKYNILKEHVATDWVLAHEVGCKGCKGTYYYGPKQEWSFLDMILLSDSFMGSNAWTLDTKSVQIANSVPEQKDKRGYPNSFNPKKRVGASDHWPIYLEIVRSKNK